MQEYVVILLACFALLPCKERYMAREDRNNITLFCYIQVFHCNGADCVLILLLFQPKLIRILTDYAANPHIMK